MPGKIVHCTKCGVAIEGGPTGAGRHWRDAHPGEVSDRAQEKLRAKARKAATAAASNKVRGRGAEAAFESLRSGDALGNVDGASGQPTSATPTAGAGDPLPGFDVGPDELRPELPDDVEVTPLPPRRRGWREFLGLRPKSNQPVSRETRPVRYKRESTADIIGTIYGGAGAILVRTGVDPPVGRCLEFQASLAGEALDKVVAGTSLDVPLQWAARNTDQAQLLSDLFLLPIMIFAYQRVPPESRALLEPWMERAVRGNLRATLPVIKRKRAEDREMQKVLDELKAENMIDPELATVDDAVHAILDAMFAGAENVVPEPSPNGQGAAAEQEVRA